MIQTSKAFDRHAKAPFMVVRISLILAMLGASLFSPAIQAGPGDSPVGSGQIERHPRPLPPGRGNAIQRTVLGDPVVVDDWQIEQVSPSGQKCSFAPFTEAEVRKDAKAGTLKQLGRVTIVNTPKGPIPITAYVSQINAFEQWVCKYGVSLRDKGFTGRDGVTRLPLRFRLKAYGTKSPFETNTNQATIGHRLVIDPGYPVDAVMRPSDAYRVRGTEILAQWAKAQRALLGAAKARTGPAPLNSMSGDAPPLCQQTCTLQYGSGAGGLVLSEVGQRIVDDASYVETCYYTKDVFGGRVPVVGCLDDDLGGSAKSETKTTFWRDIYGATYGKDAVDALVKNYQTPCIIAAIRSDLIDAFYLGAKGSSPGKKTALSGAKAGTFWDGILRLGWANANDCIGNTSGNGWFSGYACLDYSAHANYAKATGLDVADTAGVDATITLFGQNFQIAKGDQTISWTQSMTGGFVAPVITGTKYKYGDSEHFETPPFIIPIGPVPLSVTAGLDVSFTLGTLPPQQNFLQLFAAHQGPKMSMSSPVGAEAKMSVFLDADIDVIVAKAGIEGSLNAFDGQVDGSISSSIDALSNVATLSKSYAFKGSAFSGSISAFVEVWYVLGSKRWSIEVIDFTGVEGDGTVTKIDFPGSAVIPEQAKPDCNT